MALNLVENTIDKIERALKPNASLGNLKGAQKYKRRSNLKAYGEAIAEAATETEKIIREAGQVAGAGAGYHA